MLDDSLPSLTIGYLMLNDSLPSFTIGYLMLDDSLGFPYLKIDKFGGFTKFIFHVFDRYEIHIQAFLYFINGNLWMSVPHLHKIIFNICTQKIARNSENIDNKIEKTWYLGHTDFDFFWNFWCPILAQIICFQDDSIIFLVFFEAFW